VAGCITCHTPQTTDPDTGNTVDMATMIHKIHKGKDLPSVQAGTPYRIIGNQQAVHDYSHIGFSAYPDTRNCVACHEQGKAPGRRTSG
jgi:OmcA/MtrC family decaheme c-type cytochrome